MDININLSVLAQKLKRSLWSHNYSVFITVLAVVIMLAMLSLTSVINVQADSSTTSSDSSLTFDKTTIERVKQLKDNPSTTVITLPTNQRVDPFSERS